MLRHAVLLAVFALAVPVPAWAAAPPSPPSPVSGNTRFALERYDKLRDREGNTPRMVSEFSRRREQFTRDLNRIPGFRCHPPEGAFYAWVDISGTGISAEALCRILLEEAGVAVIPGAAFGAAGKDFIRFSFASSRETLREAVERIMRAASAWQGTVAVR